jgi:2-methylcitrate dehydratase PrpD
MRKIDFRVHPEAEAAGFDKMTTLVEITLADGRVIKGRADFGKGSPATPMSDGELEEKFRQCAQWGGFEDARTDAVLGLLWEIEMVRDMGELMTLLGR